MRSLYPERRRWPAQTREFGKEDHESSHSERELEPISSIVPRKEPLGIFRRRRAARLPQRVRSQRRIVATALEVSIDSLLQLQQRLERADLETGMPAGVGGGCIAAVLGQGNVYLLARRANVEPEKPVGLRGGNGSWGETQGVGVETAGEREGLVWDGDIDVI